MCTRQCDSIEEFGLKDQPDIGWRQTTDKDLISEEPTWVVGEWSSCSNECGQGKQRRVVECKMLFRLSGTVATLPDEQCHLESKPEIEKDCLNKRPCDEENEIEQETKLYKHKVGSTKNHEKINDEANQVIVAMPSEPAHSTILLDSSINEISNRNDDINSNNNFNDFSSPYRWKEAGFTDCTAQCLGGWFFFVFFLL